MKQNANSCGPWTTSLDSGWRLELSAFWRRRMAALPRLTATSRRRRLALTCTVTMAGILAITPLVQFEISASQAEKPESEDSPSPPNAQPAAKDKGSELLRRLQRAGAPHLKALQEEHGYDLADDQHLKRIPPPFPDARMRWYRAAKPGQAESIPAGPDSMLFRMEKGAPRNWGMSFGGYDVDDVLEAAAGVFPQTIEGPSEIRKRDVPGDWIVQADASQEKIVADLEAILNHELAMNVRLRFAEVSREVYVARGRYKHDPLPDETAVSETQLIDRVARADIVHIFGAEFDLNSGAGGGMGDFATFCEWLGEWIGAPIVSDVAQPPSGEISWRLHQPSPFTSEQRAEAHDAKLVLANVSKQTGLEFVREKRPVKMLIIEAAEPE